MKANSLILFLSLLFCSIVSAEIDVNDISIRGDSTLMGMKIESSYFANGAFLIETTGARFEYAKGDLKIFQGLNAKERRLLSTISFDNEPNFISVESNDDHILLWSKDINLGFYGDSTLIISPKVKQQLKCKGNFKPDYEGRYKGELLLIDDLGGMEIYPQRYEAGYELERIELGKKNWVADYLLNANERVMIAAFPGRPFDWEKSFRSHFLGTTGEYSADTYGRGNMPPDILIKNWSKDIDIMALHWDALWKTRKNYGPYEVLNPKDFRRMINTAHKYGMKVASHCSLLYFYREYEDTEAFFNQVKAVYHKFGTDGVWVDGLTFDQRGYKKIDNKIGNWEMIRRLRQLFGKDGVIVFHGTHLGTPVSTVPNIDTYCDVTAFGEGVYFDSVNDPYVKYQIRKYGISNTVGTWLTDRKPKKISNEQLVNALIRMNCRDWWGAHNYYRKYNSRFLYYLKQIAKLERTYRRSNTAKF